MAKSIFAGRKNCKRDFYDYLIRMAVDTKGARHLLPFRKKKDGDETYPRILLLYGAPGTGKSAMVRQYIDIAQAMGPELKKPLKIVSVDCEEILLKNVMMLRTLIQSLYAVFSSEEVGSAGCFSEYAQIERRITYIHEKVEHLCNREWDSERMTANGPDQGIPNDFQPDKEKNSKGSSALEGNRRTDEEGRKQKAFTTWLHDTGKLQEDELDIYENSDYRLSKALVNGIIQLSQQYPVILAIDSFDRVSNREIEEWMRDVFLGKLFERKNNVLVILSGRGDFLRNYRNVFPEELLHAVNFDDYPLTRFDIADCAQSYQVQVSKEQVDRIEDVTNGIPFVVRNLLGLVKDTASLAEQLDALGRTKGAIEQMVIAEVNRFLTYCPDHAVTRNIVQCACMRRLEYTILSKLWNVAFADVGPLIAEYAARYPFIVDDQTQVRGHALLRDYCIKAAAQGNEKEIISMVEEFGTLAAPLFLDQITQLSTAVALIEKRYEDDRFQEAILAYCNALLWHDRRRLFQILPGILLECLQYNCMFAVRLLQCIDEFRVTLDSELIRVVDTYINGILSYHPMGTWLDTVPGEEETAMVRLIEEHAADCDERQLALLDCRQGELQYRLKDYPKASEHFEKCLPFTKDSDAFKKNIIDDLFALGNKLFAAGSHEAAVRVFKHVVDLKPDDYEAWYTMGRSQTELGRTADSALSYVRTVELKPDLHDCWRRLGMAYFGLESYENTVEALTRALGMKSGSGMDWFTLGRAYGKLERYDDAVLALKKAAELEPDDKNIWIESGAANASAGSHENAEVSYEKAVKLDQQLHQAWFGLGKALYRLGQFAKAMAAFGNALSIVRDNKEYIYHMALACHAAQDYDAAIRNWGKYIEIEPSNYQAHYRMALSIHARGQYSDAIQFYLKAAEGLPENIEIPHNLGRAYHAQGLYNDAVEQYRKALQVDPSKPELWDDLGLVFTEMNLYGDAIQAYKELVRLTPDWKDAWYHLGHTYYLIRHYENALQSYGKAVEIDPRYYLAWGSLGLTYYALRNYEKAIEASSKAVSIKSDEMWVQNNLALSTFLSGNLPQAAVEYDKVIILAKTREDLQPPITALEDVIARSPEGEKGKEILEKLKKVLSEK
jgi:tetratricopeptide (TPR) repeat protein